MRSRRSLKVSHTQQASLAGRLTTTGGGSIHVHVPIYAHPYIN